MNLALNDVLVIVLIIVVATTAALQLPLMVLRRLKGGLMVNAGTATAR